MVLLASWQAYLARWTATDDFLIGTPVANRPRPELDNVVGMFANTIVLRADLRGDPSFAELVARVRHRQLEALAHRTPVRAASRSAGTAASAGSHAAFPDDVHAAATARPAHACEAEAAWEPLRIPTGCRDTT